MSRLLRTKFPVNDNNLKSKVQVNDENYCYKYYKSNRCLGSGQDIRLTASIMKTAVIARIKQTV